jgi:hypothetical protein
VNWKTEKEGGEKKTRHASLIHLAEMLQVSKLTKRENRTDFEKGIREPLLTGLVIFVNRYVRSVADFRPLSTDRPDALHQSVHLTFHVYIGLSLANLPRPAKKKSSATLKGLYEPCEFELAVRQEQ